MTSRLDFERHGVLLSLAAIAVLIAVAGLVRVTDSDDSREPTLSEAAPAAGHQLPLPPVVAPPNSRPGGVVKSDGKPGIFDDGRFLVAYYGTAGTSALGVLGETGPDVMHERLRLAAKAFKATGRPVRLVYELIVTVADRSAGSDGATATTSHVRTSRGTSTRPGATTRCCCSTSSPATATSSTWRSAGSGRSRSRTWAWPSTRSGGWDVRYRAR